MWQSVGLTLLVIVATLVCALLFMLFGKFRFSQEFLFLSCAEEEFGRCQNINMAAPLLMSAGWYVVWQLFLSKFKFLRELVGDASTPPAETQPSETKSERTANAPTRNRPKTARQRVASPESTS